MLPIRDSIPSRNFPVVNYAIIAVNAAVFFFELSLGEKGLQRLFYEFGLVPVLYAAPDRFPDAQTLDFVVPFFSSMFLHGGWMHFIGNMWILHIFGDNVEDELGKGRYLLFYLLGGLAAGGLQTGVSWGSEVPMIGASGAIAGVMGAYVLLYPHGKVLTLLPLGFYSRFVDMPAYLFMGLWIFTQLYSGSFAVLAGAAGFGGVAWWAHVGGFLGGLLLLPLLRPRHAVRPLHYRTY